MKNIIIVSLALSFSSILANQIPEISLCNVQLKSGLLEISYDLNDVDNNQLEVKCQIFIHSGSNKYKSIDIKSITGAIGFPINIGSNKKILVELSNAEDYNKELNVSLSAYDKEAIDIPSIISQVNTVRIQNELLILQGRRNEITDKNFKESARNYILSQASGKTLVNKFESKVGSVTNINYEFNQFGTNSPEIIQIVDAHYDSFNQAPGVDDNASGVSGVLEIYRILGKYASQKSIRYLFFDLEENGLVGSNLYINNQLHANDIIDNVINYEMIGYYTEQDNTQDLPNGFNILFPDAYNDVIANNRKGNFITNVGNNNSNALIQVFYNSAIQYVPSLKVINLEVPGNGTVVPDLRRSDHANFWDKGKKALMITDGANFRNKNYHTIKDSLQYLNMDFMSNVIKTSIASLIELAGVEHGTAVNMFYNPANLVKNTILNDLQIRKTNSGILINPGDNNLPTQLRIFNLDGKIVHYSIIKGLISIELSSLNSGVYYFTLENANSKLIQKIFVTTP